MHNRKLIKERTEAKITFVSVKKENPGGNETQMSTKKNYGH